MITRKNIERIYNKGRMSLIMMLGLTVVTLVLSYTDAGFEFPYSAFAPLFFNAMMQMPEDAEYSITPNGETLLIALIVLSLAAYALCFFLSKKRAGWMRAALVLYVLDTLLLVMLSIQSGTIDAYLLHILFHAWVIYDLFRAVQSSKKLNNLPPEDIILDENSPLEIQDE